jgi:hypothetical protein
MVRRTQRGAYSLHSHDLDLRFTAVGDAQASAYGEAA